MAASKGISQQQNSNRFGDISIPISRLHLSLTNPRHEPLGTETEAIQKLCNEEMVSAIAQDIARRGALSPLDVMGVIPMKGNPGHFIALEGNRRACALILLADPDRAPTKFREQFRRMTKGISIPREIKAHVFRAATEAKQWVDLRHLGYQGGVGTKEWNPKQKTRAAGDNSRTTARANTLALLVLDRLTKRNMLPNDQRNQVSLTTLTRYLGTPGVRAILGLASANELIYTHDADEIDKALLRLTLDSVEPLSNGSYRVNSRSNSTERLDYANKLKSRGFAPITSVRTPSVPPKPTKLDSSLQRHKSVNHPDKRATLFLPSFTITHRDSVLRRLRQEAIDLKIDDFPFSSNYLLRAIIEQIMILFAKKRGRYSDSLTDLQLTSICAEELKNIGIKGRALSVIQKAAGHKDTPYSLHSLGHALHGGTIPTARDLRAYADTWEPTLLAMLGSL